MKITQQKLQQLIRESIFKRMFGKKEKTKAGIPDEIASDFGGGKEDIVDDFNAEQDDSDDNEGFNIKRRELAKAAVAGSAAVAGLKASGVGSSNLLRQSLETYTGISMDVHVEMYGLTSTSEKFNEQKFNLPIELLPELVQKVIENYRVVQTRLEELDVFMEQNYRFIPEFSLMKPNSPEVGQQYRAMEEAMRPDIKKWAYSCNDLFTFVMNQVEKQLGEFGKDGIYYQYDPGDVIGSPELEEALN